jgi:hypothetical protein
MLAADMLAAARQASGKLTVWRQAGRQDSGKLAAGRHHADRKICWRQADRLVAGRLGTVQCRETACRYRVIESQKG